MCRPNLSKCLSSELLPKRSQKDLELKECISFFAVKHGEVGNLLNEEVKLWRLLQNLLYLGYIFGEEEETKAEAGSFWFAVSALWPL